MNAGSSHSPRLTLSGVGKVYAQRGEPLSAVRQVDLTLAPSAFVSLEGPSGCGKTTLLNLIGLLDLPSAGEIRWDGTSTNGWKERERARRRLTSIGFIFQRFYLLPTLTAMENVELPMRALGTPADARRRRAAELLERVGLTSRSRAFPYQLSGGEEQRVAIARALANSPGLVLADEPTGELDQSNTEGILKLLEEAHRDLGTTLIVATHNPKVAARADRHLTMLDGRIVADRSPE
ncbi:MAG TPA: ABC transporter ATP-binding protein [Thermoplasmata archaeon]|nr:ABC transporter ATP-binding protein [Thermoplasmata archaeon]